MPPKPIGPARLWSAIVMNLCATPGLGSLMCRRTWSGLGQLTLSVSGFCLIVLWMLRNIYGSVMRQINDLPPAPPADWQWHWGVLLFGASWLWALVTSVGMWREALALKDAKQAVPPKISEIDPP